MDITMYHLLFLLALLKSSAAAASNFVSYDPLVHCDEVYIPKYCGYPDINLDALANLHDFDRCGPAALPNLERNYFWGGSGTKVTYRANFAGFKKLAIKPRYFGDVKTISESSVETTVLGQTIAFPVGISPWAYHFLASPEGEKATARAAVSRMGTVMVVGSLSPYPLEEVAAAVRASNPQRPPTLWIQTYLLDNRQNMLQLMRRAERSGYQAVVITVDIPFAAELSCNSREKTQALNIKLPDYINATFPGDERVSAFQSEYLRWVRANTNLYIVVKGILTGADAKKAVMTGASAIFVSNHGGRQVDSAPATIDALPEVVKAVKKYPSVEVYLDGGIRSGRDVFKALALGARAVFVGRPSVWGLAIAGEEGVYKMLSILKSEFNETMLLAGARYPEEIDGSYVVKKDSVC